MLGIVHAELLQVLSISFLGCGALHSSQQYVGIRIALTFSSQVDIVSPVNSSLFDFNYFDRVSSLIIGKCNLKIMF